MPYQYSITCVNEPNPYLLAEGYVDLLMGRIKRSESPAQMLDAVIGTLERMVEKEDKSKKKVV